MDDTEARRALDRSAIDQSVASMADMAIDIFTRLVAGGLSRPEALALTQTWMRALLEKGLSDNVS